jgi:hypothetical protein
MSFGETCRLGLQGQRISHTRKKCEASSEKRKLLKMDTICSSETSVVFQRSTPSYMAEDTNLHNHCCDNLKSYTLAASFKLNHKRKIFYNSVGSEQQKRKNSSEHKPF